MKRLVVFFYEIAMTHSLSEYKYAADKLNKNRQICKSPLQSRQKEGSWLLLFNFLKFFLTVASYLQEQGLQCRYTDQGLWSLKSI